MAVDSAMNSAIAAGLGPDGDLTTGKRLQVDFTIFYLPTLIRHAPVFLCSHGNTLHERMPVVCSYDLAMVFYLIS